MRIKFHSVGRLLPDAVPKLRKLGTIQYFFPGFYLLWFVGIFDLELLRKRSQAGFDGVFRRSIDLRH